MGFKDKVKVTCGFYKGFTGVCIAPGDTKILVRLWFDPMALFSPTNYVDAWLLPEELVVIKDVK